MFTGGVRYAIGSTPVSRWVWVLLAFAIGYALPLVTQTRTLDLPNASNIAFSTARALGGRGGRHRPTPAASQQMTIRR